MSTDEELRGAAQQLSTSLLMLRRLRRRAPSMSPAEIASELSGIVDGMPCLKMCALVDRMWVEHRSKP
jgi:hypothetical protein